MVLNEFLCVSLKRIWCQIVPGNVYTWITFHSLQMEFGWYLFYWHLLCKFLGSRILHASLNVLFFFFQYLQVKCLDLLCFFVCLVMLASVEKDLLHSMQMYLMPWWTHSWCLLRINLDAKHLLRFCRHVNKISAHLQRSLSPFHSICKVVSSL